jgi:hypothetical protein
MEEDEVVEADRGPFLQVSSLLFWLQQEVKQTKTGI